MGIKKVKVNIAAKQVVKTIRLIIIIPFIMSGAVFFLIKNQFMLPLIKSNSETHMLKEVIKSPIEGVKPAPRSSL